MILAIDTTGEWGSVALARGGEVVEARAIRSAEGFGHVIFQQILALLERHGVALGEIGGYAAASGPGSFTGVRIGLTAAKGLAEAHGKRVAPVSNLMALASMGRGGLRAPVIDARRGEIYGAVYDAELRVVVEEVVAPWERFRELVGAREVTFVAAEGTRIEGVQVMEVSRALAGAVAVVGARMLAEGHGLLPEQVEANYVRRSDAELKWRE